MYVDFGILWRNVQLHHICDMHLHFRPEYHQMGTHEQNDQSFHICDRCFHLYCYILLQSVQILHICDNLGKEKVYCTIKWKLWDSVKCRPKYCTLQFYTLDLHFSYLISSSYNDS